MTPVPNENTDAAHPLLEVSLNTKGKQAAPITDGIIIAMEKNENNVAFPSTYLK
jgi:hypothetical protein